MIMSTFRWVRALGAAALVAAAAGLACAQDAADDALRDDLAAIDSADPDADLMPPPLDLDDAPALDAPPKPQLGPEPESWAAWRRAIDARLDRGVFAEIAALRAPDYLVSRGGGGGAIRAAITSFFAGGTPFNRQLVAPEAPRPRSVPGPLRPPPGPGGGAADELASFFAGVAREAQRRAGVSPPRVEPPRPTILPDRPTAFGGPPPLQVMPSAAAPERAPPATAPPRIVRPPPGDGAEPALAEDLADFFADS